MNQFTLEKNYSSNQDMREKLYPLFNKAFGIDMDTFKDFYARGFWNPTYMPFTYFHHDKAIANVSVFDLPLIINKEKILAAGIQSVMTDPDFRGMGLMNSLMEKTLEHIDNQYELVFLMTSNPSLYQKHGFRVVKEHYFTKKHVHSPKKESKLQHLDIFSEKDLQKIRWSFQHNRPSSLRFYPTSYDSSFYLNMYHPILHKMVYYSADLEVIIIYEIDDGVLELYDIIGPTLPKLEDIYAVIPNPFHTVNLYFSPDQFEEDFTAIEHEHTNKLMVRGKMDLETLLFKLPITAEF